MADKAKIDVLMAGVGGQGIILASDILAEVAIAAGYDTKKSDVHGMAQRGGSVVSHVRLGERVHSPLAARGAVDYLLAFEKLEAARFAEHLRPGGTAVVNDLAIPPMAVSSGAQAYPSDEVLLELLQRDGRKVCLVPGQAIAMDLGNPRVLNLVMLGYLSTFLPFGPDLWDAAIAAHVPARFLELNRQAFACGRAAVR
ncbi:MAG: indolepyruvate oxidoreductase subunit beta [Chloroflexi bacterium]|nr:indolepyruvate oxidoreductase subunit beta [Chloroflexota bacterium]